ncbi:hypothetical protein FXO38_36674 [Capsicum annuum]|nr:hypothetical protein FXO38_36674 [Capsicum annuum]KAF3625890.1 hypothetical protein FXO37_30626 [Capsicum annuum]
MENVNGRKLVEPERGVDLSGNWNIDWGKTKKDEEQTLGRDGGGISAIGPSGKNQKERLKVTWTSRTVRVVLLQDQLDLLICLHQLMVAKTGLEWMNSYTSHQYKMYTQLVILVVFLKVQADKFFQHWLKSDGPSNRLLHISQKKNTLPQYDGLNDDPSQP